MNGDENNDWRFQKTKLDPAYSGLDRGYNSRTGQLAAAPVNAASRVIPSPSNTNWNSTFNQNNPASPSGTDWAKTFSNRNNNGSPARSTPSLGDQSQSSLYVGEDFRDRFSSPVIPPNYEPKNVTKHQNLYGWGDGSPSATDKKWSEQSYA